MEFLTDNRIKVDPPKKPKKLTATRFATVLGLNAWATPFEAWCAITRTYEEPFEDTIYTKAGKVIEPKVIEYLNDVMFMDIKSPTDVYGPDYFKKTWGDFFPDVTALGGMWDAIGDDFVVEIKTTKRTASFLEDKDYANPEAFEPSYKNTKIYEFKLSEAFPDFEDRYVKPALAFWKENVETGISPEYDEKKDAEILKVLRKNTIEPDDKGISKLIAEADRIQAAIDKAEAKLEEKKSRLKEIDKIVKDYMSGQFRDGDKKVEIPGKKYIWTLTKSVRKTVDNNALKADGVYEKYLKESETLTLKKAVIEEAE